MVEATRVGTVYAFNEKALKKYLARRGQASQSLSPDELEAAVMRIGQMFPENVVHGVG